MHGGCVALKRNFNPSSWRPTSRRRPGSVCITYAKPYNAYVYGGNNPISSVDPEGHFIIGPPPATGPTDESWFDDEWTPIHYCAAFVAALRGRSFRQTVAGAIGWELVEPFVWKEFKETPKNQIGDVITAAIAWLDARVFIKMQPPVVLREFIRKRPKP